jgi:hypothetical protein
VARPAAQHVLQSQDLQGFGGRRLCDSILTADCMWGNPVGGLTYWALASGRAAAPLALVSPHPQPLGPNTHPHPLTPHPCDSSGGGDFQGLRREAHRHALRRV